VRAQFIDQEISKQGVVALAEKSPHIGILECCKSRNFKFQKVVLRRVQVNSMDAARAFKREREDIVTSARDGKNHIVRLHF